MEIHPTVKKKTYNFCVLTVIVKRPRINQKIVVTVDIHGECDTTKAKVFKSYSLIAQLVERLTVNQNVRGSSPRKGAK